MPRAKTARNGNVRSKSLASVSEITPSPEARKQSNGNAYDLESEIRRRAYQLYEERGCAPGREGEDWIVAEREVIARYNQHSA